MVSTWPPRCRTGRALITCNNDEVEIDRQKKRERKRERRQTRSISGVRNQLSTLKLSVLSNLSPHTHQKRKRERTSDTQHKKASERKRQSMRQKRERERALVRFNLHTRFSPKCQSYSNRCQGDWATELDMLGELWACGSLFLAVAGWQALSGGSAWGPRSPTEWETGLIQHDTLLIHALLLDLRTDTRDHGKNFFCARRDEVKPEKQCRDKSALLSMLVYGDEVHWCGDLKFSPCISSWCLLACFSYLAFLMMLSFFFFCHSVHNIHLTTSQEDF